MADFRITIDVRDVAGGDIDALANDIRDQFGDDFDAAQGDFTVTVAQKQGTSYFTRNEGDDELA